MKTNPLFTPRKTTFLLFRYLVIGMGCLFLNALLSLNANADAAKVHKEQTQNKIPYPKWNNLSYRWHIKFYSATPVWIKYEILHVANPERGNNATRIAEGSGEVYPDDPIEETGYHFWERQGPSIKIIEERPIEDKRRGKNKDKGKKPNAQQENELSGTRPPTWINAPPKREPKKMTPEEVEQWKKREEERNRKEMKPLTSNLSEIRGIWKSEWRDYAKNVPRSMGWLHGTKIVNITSDGIASETETMEGFNSPQIIFAPGGPGRGHWKTVTSSRNVLKPLGNGRFEGRQVSKSGSKGAHVVDDPLATPGRFVLVHSGRILYIEGNPKVRYSRPSDMPPMAR